ncbi:hypothetical protein BDR04DRAFT_1008042, partial [Suillus decipiens]
FPCTPQTPSLQSFSMHSSLAVDLHVLEFVCLLFICQASNQTVWCDVVETFLDGMGYKLSCKNNLHHHFSHTFHWY